MESQKPMSWMTADRVRLLALLVLAQMALWFAILTVFDADEGSIGYIAIGASEIAEPAAPTWEAVRQAEYEAFEPPLRICCQAKHYAVRFVFELERVPQDGLGLLHEMRADAYQIRMNRMEVLRRGDLALDSVGLEGRSHHAILRVPPESLQTGRNELVMLLAAKEGGLALTINEPLLADYADLQQVYGLRAFILTDYKLVSMAIGFMVAILAFLAWYRGDRQPYLFWLATVAALWGCAIMLQLWGSMPLPIRLRSFFMVLVYITLPFFWILLINSWGGSRIPHLGKIAAGVIPAVILATAIAYSTRTGTGGMVLSEEVVGFVATVIGMVGLALLLVWKFPRIDRTMHFEFAIYSAMVVVITRDLLVRSPELRLPVLNIVLPVLLVALAVGFISRNIRLFRSAEQINTLLQTQLADRTAELAIAHDREKGLLREQAHQEERQRILRDMHDGLGSSLMSMMLAARRGKAEPEKVASGLQGVIDEMRLLIDSMDTVGESLHSALALLRERSKERVPAGGFAFDWTDRSGGSLPEMPPRSVLQVFRVLQEAMTNALKHSDGNRIEVLVERDAISVLDNGSRFEGPRAGGRGLENMATRATAVGGEFSMERRDGWTIARIALPTVGASTPEAAD
ncbi:MAG: hypothetical protein KDD90_03115 [Sphingomonadaceae bacterium]|nr:hypothetical protein [Sphingomonadaceae bacterium]